MRATLYKRLADAKAELKQQEKEYEERGKELAAERDRIAAEERNLLQTDLINAIITLAPAALRKKIADVSYSIDADSWTQEALREAVQYANDKTAGTYQCCENVDIQHLCVRWLLSGIVDAEQDRKEEKDKSKVSI
jgi:hypothetical protein